MPFPGPEYIDSEARRRAKSTFDSLLRDLGATNLQIERIEDWKRFMILKGLFEVSGETSSPSADANATASSADTSPLGLDTPREKLGREEECSICQEPYTKEDREVKTICGHLMGLACLSRWMFEEKKTSCPMCRRSLFRLPQLPPSEQEPSRGHRAQENRTESRVTGRGVNLDLFTHSSTRNPIHEPSRGHRAQENRARRVLYSQGVNLNLFTHSNTRNPIQEPSQGHRAQENRAGRDPSSRGVNLNLFTDSSTLSPIQESPYRQQTLGTLRGQYLAHGLHDRDFERRHSGDRRQRNASHRTHPYRRQNEAANDESSFVVREEYRAYVEERRQRWEQREEWTLWRRR